MPLFVLEKEIKFPPSHLAEPDGLLAIGGDLSQERLLEAYRQGIFPWYEGDHILWWAPDPRFVLFPDELKVSKSMQQLLKRNAFEFTINKAFDQVIRNCREIDRKQQGGTWISEEVQSAYVLLHQTGHAHSAEAWKDGELVGGLYGVQVGSMFCGESMFAHVSNASKYAFIKYVSYLREKNFRLIDCQVHTEHLESLGARMIPRKEFLRLLRENLSQAAIDK